MSTDPQGRIAAAVRTLADALPVTPPDPRHLISRARVSSRPGAVPSRPVGRIGPLVSAAAVLAVIAGAAVLGPDPGTRPAPAPGAPGDGTVVASRPAGLSLLTATVSAAPPGPVALSYVQGAYGPRRLHTNQTVVVGADGRSYRRVDEAERRGGPAEFGTWQDAPILLSPDGGTAAVGSVRSARSLGVVDMRTGRTREYPIDPAGVVWPLAWSPDGSRLVYGVRPVTDGQPPPATADLTMLDLGTGGSSRLPFTASGVAFSPDGTRLAVQGDPEVESGTQRAVRLVDADGGNPVTLAAPGFGVRLAGQHAWSPDGRWIAMVDNAGSGKQPSQVVLLATDPDGPAPPAPIPSPTAEVDSLAWRSPERLLITDRSPAEGRVVYESTLDGEMRPVITMQDGWLPGFGTTGAVQIAGGSLSAARFADVGEVDRGPWPWWWRLTLAVAALLAAVAAVRAARGISARRGRAG